jgi:hypothetical protein
MSNWSRAFSLHLIERGVEAEVAGVPGFRRQNAGRAAENGLALQERSGSPHQAETPTSSIALEPGKTTSKTSSGRR